MTIKISILGKPKSGKTCFFNRFIYDEYDDQTKETRFTYTGVKSTYALTPEESTTFSISDTPAEVDPKTLKDYDILLHILPLDQESLGSSLRMQLDNLAQVRFNKKVVHLIAFTKTDLNEELIKTNHAEAIAIAKKYNMDAIFVSANTGEGFELEKWFIQNLQVSAAVEKKEDDAQAFYSSAVIQKLLKEIREYQPHKVQREKEIARSGMVKFLESKETSQGELCLQLRENPNYAKGLFSKTKAFAKRTLTVVKEEKASTKELQPILNEVFKKRCRVTLSSNHRQQDKIGKIRALNACEALLCGKMTPAQFEATILDSKGYDAVSYGKSDTKRLVDKTRVEYIKDQNSNLSAIVQTPASRKAA